MSEPVKPITQDECRKRLYKAVCHASAGDAVSPEDCAEWIVALLSLAALLAGIPMDRHDVFITRSTAEMLAIKQEAATREGAPGPPGDTDQG